MPGKNGGKGGGKPSSKPNPNFPSTTGKKSGARRGNNPSKK